MDKRAKILVVEDDNDINKLLCSIFENKGYKPRGAFSGTEALMCVENEKWHMILLDLMIPGLSVDEAILLTLAKYYICLIDFIWQIR